MEVKGNIGRGSVAIKGRSIDYLGYVFATNGVRLRKSIKQEFARTSHRIQNPKRRRQVLASYWGWCKWGNCKNLWRVITNNDMSFASKGIHQDQFTKDGKKFFDVKSTRITDILNVPITVLDFEAGIKTKEGDGRYCVLFEDANHEKGKFITNAFNLKNVLDQARAAEQKGTKIFPVDGVVIRRRSLGDGKSAYYFDE
jgi:hypothetical protein